jgi:hypothetical protein
MHLIIPGLINFISIHLKIWFIFILLDSKRLFDFLIINIIIFLKLFIRGFNLFINFTLIVFKMALKWFLFHFKILWICIILRLFKALPIVLHAKFVLYNLIFILNNKSLMLVLILFKKICNSLIWHLISNFLMII